MASIAYLYGLMSSHLYTESHHFVSTNSPLTYFISIITLNHKYTVFSLLLKMLTSNFIHYLTLSSMVVPSIIVTALSWKISLCSILISQMSCNKVVKIVSLLML